MIKIDHLTKEEMKLLEELINMGSHWYTTSPEDRTRVFDLMAKIGLIKRRQNVDE